MLLIHIFSHFVSVFLLTLLLIPPLAFAQPQVSPPIELVGSVRDLITGAAVPGASVSCGDSTTLTSSVGQFRLPKQVGKTCRLKIEAKGYFPLPKANFLIGSSMGLEPTDPVFKMIPAARVSGTVRTRERQPVEGATVYLMVRRRNSKMRSLSSIQSVSTVKDGSFLIEHIRPGNYYLLCSPPRTPIGKTALAPTFFPSSGVLQTVCLLFSALCARMTLARIS
jgi:hypothetical protein